MSPHTPTWKPLHAWRLVSAAVAVTAVACVAPGFASAHYGAGDVVRQVAPAQLTSAQLNRIDRLGPKYVTAPAVPSPDAVPQPTSGSDWMPVGLALALSLIALASVLFATLVVRRHRHQAEPDEGSLAGA